jgi:hypothetical protein
MRCQVTVRHEQADGSGFAPALGRRKREEIDPALGQVATQLGKRADFVIER